MASYLVLVGRVVRSGQRSECACFGTFSAGVVGWSTVICNTLLMLGAFGVVIQGAAGGGLVPWLVDADSSAWWWLAMAAFVVLAVGSVLYIPASQPAAESAGRDAGAGAGDGLQDYIRLPIPYVALETPAGETSLSA